MDFKRLIMLFSFFLISQFSISQNVGMGEKYKSETKKVLSHFMKEMGITSKAVLNSSVESGSMAIIECSMIVNSSEFTKKEKAQINKEIESFVNFKWTNEYAENLRIVERSEIRRIFEDHENGWDNFRKEYGDSIINFSKPIFLRNYTICIISYSISSDYLAGYGVTSAYKKINGEWKQFEGGCGWDS